MKNKLIIRTIFISIIFVSFININCDGPIGPVSDITGKVYNQAHFPVQNLKVSAQGKSTFTSEDGSYDLEGINFPYDLTLTDSVFNRHYSFIYKGINVNSLEIPVVNFHYVQAFPVIKVKIPEEIFQPDVYCKVIFSDRNFINIYKTYVANDLNISLEIPYSNNVINGKLYVFAYKLDSDYNIISYENYGVSPELHVQNGELIEYNFTPEQLSLNPGEREVDCRIESTKNPFLSNSFYLTFSDKAPIYYSDYVFSQYYVNNFQIKIPTGIPDTYYTYLDCVNYNAQTSSSGKMLVDPDNINVLKLNEPCQDLFPPNNTENVNNSTVFSFSPGEGNGINEIELFNNRSGNSYYIITSSNSFTLDGLEDIINEDFSNDNFSWLVWRKGTFSSIDDYTKNYFNRQNIFSTQSWNGYFTFEP